MNKKEVQERLEKRLRNVLREQSMARLTTADGRSTLSEDESPYRGNRSEAISGNGKTRAEKAAERARINALCEAIGLLTDEHPVKVELGAKDNLYA